MLVGLYESACAATSLAIRAVRDADAQAARELAGLKPRFDAQVQALLARQATRLRPDDPDYLHLARLQMSIVDKLGRINALAARAAEGVRGVAEVGATCA